MVDSGVPGAVRNSSGRSIGRRRTGRRGDQRGIASRGRSARRRATSGKMPSVAAAALRGRGATGWLGFPPRRRRLPPAAQGSINCNSRLSNSRSIARRRVSGSVALKGERERKSRPAAPRRNRRVHQQPHLLAGDAPRRRLAGRQRRQLPAKALIGLRLHGGPDGRSEAGQERLPANPRGVIAQFDARAQRPPIDQQQIDLPAEVPQIVSRRTDQGAMLMGVGDAHLLRPTLHPGELLADQVAAEVPRQDAVELGPELPQPGRFGGRGRRGRTNQPQSQPRRLLREAPAKGPRQRRSR